MTLDSTGTSANAVDSKPDNEPTTIGPEVRNCPDVKEDLCWSYLFIHHAKVDKIEERLKKDFRTFVHTTIIYKRENAHVRKTEHPTISGLLFIQGECRKIQAFLSANFFGLYLVKDCSTGRVATIPHDVMLSFMQVSRVAPTRIRFMPHPFDYYSTGNALVRITSGPLAGMEGYRIRVARDKCFITSLGGMTVAIGGIHKESFENMDEYVKLRRAQLREVHHSIDTVLTPLQAEIDRCFFNPQNRLDMMAMAESLSSWVARAKNSVRSKDFDSAAEIVLFMLEEAGSRFQTVYGNPGIGDAKEIVSVCREADSILQSILDSTDVSADLKEIVETGREALAIRFAFLGL